MDVILIGNRPEIHQRLDNTLKNTLVNIIKIPERQLNAVGDIRNILASHTICTILVDLVNTTLNTIDLVKELRDMYSYNEVAIIGVLKMHIPDIEIQLLQNGVNDFIYEDQEDELNKIRVHNYVDVYINHQHLAHFGFMDDLTKLPNMKACCNAIDDLWLSAKTENLSALCVNTDYLDKYNNLYSRAAGDKVICQVVNLLMTVFKRNTDILYRLDDYGIIILLKNTDLEGAKLLADRALNTIRSAFIEHKDSPNGIMTASIGFTSCKPAEIHSTPVKFLDTLELALLIAKRKGRDCCHYEPCRLA